MVRRNGDSVTEGVSRRVGRATGNNRDGAGVLAVGTQRDVRPVIGAMKLPGYLLGELGHTDHLVAHRGRRDSDSAAVLLVGPLQQPAPAAATRRSACGSLQGSCG